MGQPGHLPVGPIGDDSFSVMKFDEQDWSWRRESNPQPTDYKSVALPLSYASVSSCFRYLANTFETFNTIGPYVRRTLSFFSIGQITDDSEIVGYAEIVPVALV